MFHKGFEKCFWFLLENVFLYDIKVKSDFWCGFSGIHLRKQFGRVFFFKKKTNVKYVYFEKIQA